jgi:hypothetical protein
MLACKGGRLAQVEGCSVEQGILDISDERLQRHDLVADRRSGKDTSRYPDYDDDIILYRHNPIHQRF